MLKKPSFQNHKGIIFPINMQIILIYFSLKFVLTVNPGNLIKRI